MISVFNSLVVWLSIYNEWLSYCSSGNLLLLFQLLQPIESREGFHWNFYSLGVSFFHYAILFFLIRPVDVVRLPYLENSARVSLMCSFQFDRSCRHCWGEEMKTKTTTATTWNSLRAICVELFVVVFVAVRIQTMVSQLGHAHTHTDRVVRCVDVVVR